MRAVSSFFRSKKRKRKREIEKAFGAERERWRRNKQEWLIKYMRREKDGSAFDQV